MVNSHMATGKSSAGDIANAIAKSATTIQRRSFPRGKKPVRGREVVVKDSISQKQAYL